MRTLCWEDGVWKLKLFAVVPGRGQDYWPGIRKFYKWEGESPLKSFLLRKTPEPERLWAYGAAPEAWKTQPGEACPSLCLFLPGYGTRHVTVQLHACPVGVLTNVFPVCGHLWNHHPVKTSVMISAWRVADPFLWKGWKGIQFWVWSSRWSPKAWLLLRVAAQCIWAKRNHTVNQEVERMPGSTRPL